jgi:hypothetical protein
MDYSNYSLQRGNITIKRMKIMTLRHTIIKVQKFIIILMFREIYLKIEF